MLAVSDCDPLALVQVSPNAPMLTSMCRRLPHCARPVARAFHASTSTTAKVLVVLHGDPVPGYLKELDQNAIDFLGLKQLVEDRGHQLVVTTDKDVENELCDAAVIISQPCWPVRMTAERIAKAPKLKMCMTVGIGSDHIDLQAACERNLTVSEVAGGAWSPQPEHGVTPGTPAQARYSEGVQEILKCFFDNKAIRPEYLIAHGGELAAGRHPHSQCDTTPGSAEQKYVTGRFYL